jgi:hypothetical protein
MIRVGSIVFRVDDLQRMTAFWEAALDYVPREGPSDDDFMLLRPRDGVGPNLSFDAYRSKLQVPPRIHLDLYTEDQAGEVQRLIGLGATRGPLGQAAAGRGLRDPRGPRRQPLLRGGHHCLTGWPRSRPSITLSADQGERQARGGAV